MARRIWNRERIIDAIRGKHNQGLDLSAVWREDRALAATAYRHFGSWHAAVEAAGKSSRRKRWSKERVVAAIRDRQQQGLSLRGVSQVGDILMGAGIRHFGTWREALLAAGISSKPRKSWTASAVIEAIRARQRCGLSPDRICATDNALYEAARNHVGGWHQALDAAGVAWKPQRTWSKATVIAEIRLRQQRGLKMIGVRKTDCGLSLAARKHFGSWNGALQAAGMSPSPRRKWSAQRVIEALQAWQREHSTTSTVWREDRGLYSMAKHFFGNWGKAQRAAGVSSNRRRWTKQRVIEVIRAGYSEGGPGAAIWQDRALCMVAWTIFGSRKEALLAAGVEPVPGRKWTKALVVETIRARHRQGLPMSNAAQWDGGLVQASRRHFGTWNKALEAMGLKTFPTKWSKEKVILELRNRHRMPPEQRGSPRPLSRLARQYFGSRRAAMLAAGLDPDENKWTKQRVTEAIQDRHVQGLPLEYHRCKDRLLRAAAKRLFANWGNALAAAGVATHHATPASILKR